MKASVNMFGMVLIGLSFAASVPAAEDVDVPVQAVRPTAAPAVEAAPGAVDPNFRRLVLAHRAHPRPGLRARRSQDRVRFEPVLLEAPDGQLQLPAARGGRPDQRIHSHRSRQNRGGLRRTRDRLCPGCLEPALDDGTQRRRGFGAEGRRGEARLARVCGADPGARRIDTGAPADAP